MAGIRQSRQTWVLTGLLAGMMTLSGCGIYTFSGNVPGHLKTLAIPDFENQTAEYGIEDQLTDEVISVFRNDNTLSIRSEEEADCVIRGVIVTITDRPSTFSPDETVQEYRITLGVAVEFYDKVQDKVVWEERLSNFGVYPFTGGAGASRDEGIEEAIEKLAEDILNKTVSGW